MTTPLRNVKSWWYQLQGELHHHDADLVVYDIDAPKAAINEARKRPDRQVLAYLSIGEAEEYRTYWIAAKAIVLFENPDWKGNWAVQFWKQRWHDILDTRVADAMAKGFTGIYLDKADVIDDIENAGMVPHGIELRAAMIRLIIRLKTNFPGMHFVMQNAPELLSYRPLVNVLSGVAIEDWICGAIKTGELNERQYRQDMDNMVAASKLPAFAVEYLDEKDKDLITISRLLLERYGAIPLFRPADRSLS